MPLTAANPTPAPHGPALSDVELAHLAAAVFAAGFMAAMSAQVPAGSLDPTFASAGSQQLLLAGIGAYKSYYQFLVNALKDPTWLEPSLPVPTTPVPTAPTGTTPTTPSVPVSATALAQILAALKPATP